MRVKFGKSKNLSKATSVDKDLAKIFTSGANVILYSKDEGSKTVTLKFFNEGTINKKTKIEYLSNEDVAPSSMLSVIDDKVLFIKRMNADSMDYDLFIKEYV